MRLNHLVELRMVTDRCVPVKMHWKIDYVLSILVDIKGLSCPGDGLKRMSKEQQTLLLFIVQKIVT